jgi:hypothetical protein
MSRAHTAASRLSLWGVPIVCLLSAIGIGIAQAQNPARGETARRTSNAQNAGGGADGPRDNSTTNPPTPKIQVFIVGVPSWQVTTYHKDSILGGDIQDTCVEIKNLFTNRFGDEVQFHPADACTAAATTRDAIRDQLEFEMDKAGKGTLTFVFMMSHGESVHVENGLFQWDTLFLTSDATDANKDRQSISLDSDLMPWLQRMQNGSTVLVFVDSCNSGGVDNPAVQMEGTELNSVAGVKLGLMVASTSHASTYDTAFTRSLLDLWKSGQCPSIKIEQYLQNAISRRIGGAPLVGYDGRPEPIIPYAGGWCLSELGGQGRLLFLYQGATNYLVWKIISLDDPSKPAITVPTDTDGFEFWILRPGNYKVEADDQKGKPLYVAPHKVDFVNNSTLGVFFPGEQVTAEGAERAMNAWAGAATAKGLPQTEVAKVQEAARRVSLYLGNPPAANVTDAELAEELSEAKGDPARLRSLGEGLLEDGQFEKASRVLVKAVKAAPDDQPGASDAATEAFLAAGVMEIRKPCKL